MKIRCLILIFSIIIFSLTASASFKVGDVYEVENETLVKNKILTIENIGLGMIKVDVDGVKGIIALYEQKEVNGVDIYVQSVFYVEEPEERSTEIIVVPAFYCGDGTCDIDQNETMGNCCIDCGCNPRYVCVEEKCKSELLIRREKEIEEAKKRAESEMNSSDEQEVEEVQEEEEEEPSYEVVYEEIKPEKYVEEEKEGFFSRIINFFLNLFK